MRRLVRRLCLLLAALIAALVGVLAVHAAASPDVPGLREAAYTYNDHHRSAQVTDPATERSPPAAYDRANTYDAVDHRSRGASARTDGPAPSSITTYDDPARLLAITRGGGTTEVQVEGADVDSHVVQRPHVAANGVSPSAIRFSQSSVNGVDEIAASMRANGWVGKPIDVVRMPDGGLTAIDNTRVLAAHQAGIDVQATIRGFDEALPEGMIARFTTPKGGAPSTWGEALLNRIGAQNSGFRSTYPFGSPFTGWGGG